MPKEALRSTQHSGSCPLISKEKQKKETMRRSVPSPALSTHRDASATSSSQASGSQLVSQNRERHAVYREDSSSMLSFFAPLEKPPRTTAHRFSLLGVSQALCGLFLLDNMEAKHISVWVVTFHYLPLLAMVLGFTVDCLLHVFLSLIFPFIDFTEVLDTPGILRLFVVAMCHSGVYIGVTIAGYMILCSILDAMIDTVLFVVDPVLQVPVPHYALLQDLIQIGRYRWAAVSTMALLIGAFGFALRTAVVPQSTLGASIAPAESAMLRWATGVLFLASIWVVVSFTAFHLKHRRHISEEKYQAALTEWWRKTLPRVRRRCTYCILVAAGYRFLQEGGSEGMRSVSEGMMYLTLPHVMFVWCTGAVTFALRIVHTAVCLARSPQFALTCVSLVGPWCCLMGGSWYLFHSPLYVAAEIVPLLVMLATIHALDHGAGCGAMMKLAPHGRHSERADTAQRPAVTSPPTRGTLAVRLFLCNTKDIHRATPHFRVGRLVRTVLRVLLGAAFFSVAILGCWVALQQRGLMRGPQATTSRFVVADGEESLRIRVSTDFLVADLFGLPRSKPIDPHSLLPEDDESRDSNRYTALCSRWWHNLHAADLALFSLLPYLDRSNQTSRDFEETFQFFQQHRINGSHWQVMPTSSAHASPTHVPLVHFRSHEDRVSVIAVRGTDLAAPIDFLQNIFVFSETAIFQIFGSIVPLGAMFSDRVKAEAFAACSYLASTLFGENVLTPNPASHYYHLQVESYIARYVPPGDTIILTGHSLGGTIAQIVAARNRYVALAFASPGIGLLYRKFGISPDAIDAYTSNIIVSNDVIPLVDRMSGTIYHIQCEHTRGQICHSIELQTIRMWTMCPQYRSMVYVNGTYSITPLPYGQVLDYVLEAARTILGLLA